MISSVFAHYCTSNTHLVFKEKKNQEIVLKVYDMMHTCILKKPLQLEELKEIPFTLFPDKNLKEHVVWLIKNGYVPNPDVPGNFHRCLQKQSGPVDLLVLGSKIQAVFKIYRPKFLLTQEYPDEFLCPITGSVMIEPYSDSEGHTFEREAISKALETRKECPISNTPILTLTINRNLKEAIEKFHLKAQVPFLNASITEKTRLAELAIQNGLAYEEEELFTEALELYIKALQYTKSVDHYLMIPKLLEKMNQPAAAALCYLHLVDYLCPKIQQDEILNFLEKANTLYPNFPPILKLIAFFLEETGEAEKGELIYKKIREIYWADKSEEAYCFYTEEVEKDPLSMNLLSSINFLLFYSYLKKIYEN